MQLQEGLGPLGTRSYTLQEFKCHGMDMLTQAMVKRIKGSKDFSFFCRTNVELNVVPWYYYCSTMVKMLVIH